MRYRSINNSDFAIAIQLNGYYIATVIVTFLISKYFTESYMRHIWAPSERTKLSKTILVTTADKVHA